MKNKLLTFSLWGNNPKYNIGAIKNAQLSLKHYPGWKCRFYLGKSVPESTIDSLSQFHHVELVHMEDQGDWKGMYWRFYPASEDNVDVMCSRDCDSRLSAREAEAVAEWLESPRGFHTMRDHPFHGVSILGGMWGVKKGILPQMQKLIKDHITTENRWGIDQDFLHSIIYPLVKDIWFEHDSFYAIDHRNRYKNGFPTPRDQKTMFYVGQNFDAHDTPEILLDHPGHDRTSDYLP